MNYAGDRNPGAVIDFKFATVDSTFAPVTLAGTPAVVVYKDNSATESSAGVTLSVDFDSRTGSHHLRIDTSSDGTFYSAGSDFFAELSAGTVDGKSVVGQPLFQFSLQNRLTVAAIATAVWSAATRLLTAGTNIVLAKGVGVTGLNDLDAPGIRTAVGLASANIDTQLGGISSKTTNLPAAPAAVSDVTAVAAAVWSYATRLLSAGTNIVLAKGVGITGLNDLDAPGIRTAVGLASANTDTQFLAIAGKTANLPASPAAVSDIPTANANADALLDRAAGIEAGWTLRQALRIILSALAGKASGLDTTTSRYRDMNDTKDRIVAVDDEFGNRTAVTRDAT